MACPTDYEKKMTWAAAARAWEAAAREYDQVAADIRAAAAPTARPPDDVVCLRATTWPQRLRGTRLLLKAAWRLLTRGHVTLKL